jgi:ketosteroid isomerase-like protein
LIPQPGAEPVRGTQAIRSALEGFLALKGKVELDTKHVVQHGDIALLRSAWRVKGTGPDGKPVEMSHGSAEVVRRQPDGSWRCIIDHPFGSD